MSMSEVAISSESVPPALHLIPFLEYSNNQQDEGKERDEGEVIFKSLTDIPVYDNDPSDMSSGSCMNVSDSNNDNGNTMKCSSIEVEVEIRLKSRSSSGSSGGKGVVREMMICIQVSTLSANQYHQHQDGNFGSERLILATYTYPHTPQHDTEGSSNLEVEALGRYRNMACWATFPEPMSATGNRLDRERGKQEHKGQLYNNSACRPVLCVLVNPTLLCLCDCIPKSSVSTNKDIHQNPLPVTEIYIPFETSSVFPAAVAGGGVILNRSIKPDDQIHWSRQKLEKQEHHHVKLPISGPPKIPRYTLPKLNCVGVSGNDIDEDVQIDLVSPFILNEQEEFSMFVILDPLQEPQPIYIAESKSPNHLGDAFERLLFVSAVQNEFICVTYHLHLQRHAFWRMRRKVQGDVSNSLSVDNLSKMLENCTLFTTSNNAADAAIIDFIGGNTDKQTSSKSEEHFNDYVDVIQPSQIQIEIDLIWEEKLCQKCCAAREIFRSSGTNGELTQICLLVEKLVKNGSKTQINQNDNILRSYDFRDGKISSDLSEISCVSAQPTQTNTGYDNCEMTDVLVLRYIERSSKELSPCLCLYRAGKFIVQCIVKRSMREAESSDEHDKNIDSNRIKIVGISHAVVDRLDITYDLISRSNSNPISNHKVRVHVPITTLSPLVEEALRVLEFKFQHFSPHDDFVFRLRLDSSRLTALGLGDDNFSSRDIGWESFASVLWTLFCGYFKIRYENVNPIKTDETDFEYLLNSGFHEDFKEMNGNKYELDHDESDKTHSPYSYKTFAKVSPSELISRDGIQSLHEWSIVFDTLHLLFEESRLLLSRSLWLYPLATLLKSMCLISIESNGTKSTMSDFVYHYCRVLGWSDELFPVQQQYFIERPVSRKELTSFGSVPCIISYLARKLDGVISDPDFELNGNLHILTKVCRFYDILGKEKYSTSSSRIDYSNLVLAMVEEGFRKPADLDIFILCISIPLREVLYSFRDDPPPDWSAAAYSLIGREDLSFMHSEDDYKSIPSHPLIRFRCANLDNIAHSRRSQRNKNTECPEIVKEDTDFDGIDLLQNYSSMIFPNDKRINEASKLLCSSKPVLLQVDRPPELNDHDFKKRKVAKLALVCRRTLALSVGRGMMTAGSFRSVFAETLPVPEICLSGKVAPTNTRVILDPSSCPHDMTMWPEFHNGVAAGLRIGIDGSSGETRQITRAWIKYNKPSSTPAPVSPNRNIEKNGQNTSQHSYGGLLFALGLRGHLSKLGKTDIFDCLTTGTVTNIVGVLLGMAANKRSSCDLAVSKMLCLHVPSLLPLSFHQMDTSSVIQVAAITGLGLLYQDSSHRLMTEFLLNEIGKRPTNENNQDRESYKLACGLALGMVNLVKGGRNSAGLADLRIEERLHKYIIGGMDEKSSRGMGIRVSSNEVHGDIERNACIAELAINTEITAPASMLALALMYLKTSDKTIAGIMSIPETMTLLEYIRPDLLLLRVVTRSLVMWDDVSPTEEWLDSQIPIIIRDSYLSIGSTTNMASIAGIVSMDIGMDDTVNESNDSAEHQLGGTSKMSDEFVDKQAIRQIHAHLTAGACFALGLRFAGTWDPSAASAVFNKLRLFKSMRDGSDPSFAVLKPERPLLEMCLSCAAISLAMIMAGSGDLKCFRILRELRWKCESEVRYGDHMALNSAIGLLFLGGGACTLGREPKDIAMLITAFFPRYPKSTTDNQYHLQALRHLYILATKRREVEAIDVDTNEPVYVPIKVEFDSDSNAFTCMAPCLIPNRGIVRKISVKSDRYYNVVKRIYNQSQLELGYQYTLFVKKKAGKLSYVQDPHAMRSLLTQTGASTVSALDLIRSFTEDLRLLGFAQYFCDGRDAMDPNDLCLNEASTSQLFKRILYDCLTEEKPEAVSLHLSLLRLVSLIRNDVSIEAVGNLRFLLDYYAGFKQTSACISNLSLLNGEFLEHINVSVDSLFKFTWDDIECYFNDLQNCSWKEFQRFQAFLAWNKIPMPYLSDGSHVRI